MSKNTKGVNIWAGWYFINIKKLIYFHIQKK